jgi:chromosome segregation ATPase
MFFRYGLTPTANKLYQYVRKGSMSAPAEALSKFWSDLREKSRVRIERPDLPDEVKGAAGELVASLWALAQDRADSLMATREAEARATTIEAHAELQKTIAQRNALQSEVNGTQAALEQANKEIANLQQQLAAEKASRTAIEERVMEAHADIAMLRQANDNARTDFTAEITRLSHETELEKERLRGAERRALLEIDRERSLADKLQKELGIARIEFLRASEQHRAEHANLYRDIGNMRERIGLLEGELAAAKTQGEEVGRHLYDAKCKLEEALAHAAVLEKERTAWRIKVESAEREIERLKRKPVVREKSRNTRSLPEN